MKTRSMLRKRSGRPRSAISRIGLTVSAAEATWMLRCASCWWPENRATRLSTDEAPPRPPVKKYSGISVFQTGSWITGRP